MPSPETTQALTGFLRHRVFPVPEHSESLSVPGTQQPHPDNFPDKVSVTYFNKGNYEEINMDILTGYT